MLRWIRRFRRRSTDRARDLDSANRPGDTYRADDIPLPQWSLPTMQPKVVLVQLRATYRDPVGDDGRILHAEDATYDRRLLGALKAALRLQADFVAFPEYACPRSLASALLDVLRHDARDGQVCILPFEHLTFSDYENLLRLLQVDQVIAEEALTEVRGDRADQALAVLNVSFAIIRTSAGLTVIPQHKICPAGLEELSLGRWRFAGGSTIRIVRGANCSFATCICFDLVARDEARLRQPRTLLGDASIDFLFVPECNPDPFNPLYTRALIGLYQGAVWSAGTTITLFPNVADGSILPRLPDQPCFGYSRLVGKLGSVPDAIPHVFMLADGMLTCNSPRSIDDLASRGTPTPFMPIRSLICRGEESLVELTLPTLKTGPSRDPSAGRLDTEISVYRHVGDLPEEWQQIRRTRRPERAGEVGGIPDSLLVPGGLVGADELASELWAAVRTPSPLVWVTGDGGGGKTALVANVLHDRFASGQRPRIVWIDLAGVAAGEDVLLEEILLALGKGDALTQDVEVQWEVLRKDLAAQWTVLILDSMELWGDAVPSRLIEISGWPSRLIVTSRRSSTAAGSVALTVRPLDFEAAQLLIDRVAHSNVSADIVTPVYRVVNGLALGCAWIGGVLRLAPGDAPRLIHHIEDDPRADLRTVFDWCVRYLSSVERDVLTVMCELPGPVAREDLEIILGEPTASLTAVLRHLADRNLLAETEGDPSSLRTRHPFVRQFWQVSAPGESERLWPNVVAWARRTLERLGGDANWHGFRELRSKWPNIRRVLDLLLGPRSDEPTFLDLWRLADYFLWSSGRWRERIELGETAARVARRHDRPAILAHALYDSIAETQWHKRWGRTHAEPLLAEASAIYASLGDEMGRAMVEYYRGRLLRKTGDLDGALPAAENAVAIARREANRRLLGIALNGLANIYRSRRLFPEALRSYEEASGLLEGEGGDEEMQAVIFRNRGRIALEQGRLGAAITFLQAAMDRFEALGLRVEEAEAANFHARALALAGERAAAKDELNWALQTLDRLGSVGRAEETDETRRIIER